jgi:hypothetical protein
MNFLFIRFVTYAYRDMWVPLTFRVKFLLYMQFSLTSKFLNFAHRIYLSMPCELYNKRGLFLPKC